MASIADDRSVLGEADPVAYEYDGEEEEAFEVEEVADDEPMCIYGRVFLGSIDAARNHAALTRANVGITLALLGANDERVSEDTGSSDGSLAKAVQRVFVGMEDSLHEPLFGRLPALLAELQRVLSDAEKSECNVLVHCMAGRSRSPSLVAAWMMVTQKITLQQAIEHIQMIRPWIEINARFMRDLELYDRVLRDDPQNVALDASWKSQLTQYRSSLPRLDFGLSLVADILAHKKTVTMRLVSDVENDQNSDLQHILAHGTAVATTAGRQSDAQREPFAFLRTNRVDTGATLASVDESTLLMTGFTSKEDVLNVLKVFYPDITMQTPMLVVHFTCIGRIE